MRMSIESIKKQADKCMTVKELTNIAKILATKNIEYFGYYTFINENNEKVL